MVFPSARYGTRSICCTTAVSFRRDEIRDPVGGAFTWHVFINTLFTNGVRSGVHCVVVFPCVSSRQRVAPRSAPFDSQRLETRGDGTKRGRNAQSPHGCILSIISPVCPLLPDAKYLSGHTRRSTFTFMPLDATAKCLARV